MIFTAICVIGFIFVCVALPFAWRYESSRKRLDPHHENDFPSPYDPLLELKCPHHVLLPPRPRPEDRKND